MIVVTLHSVHPRPRTPFLTGMNRIALSITPLLLGAASLAAQGSASPEGMAGMDHMAMSSVSPKAAQEIRNVTKATFPLGAPGAAAAAGFKPVFGWIPTM